MIAATLPQLYGITAVALFPDLDAFLARLDHALANLGLRLLQVRDKQLEPAQRERLAHECVTRGHAHDCRVLINDDAELARRTGADGVHVSSQRLGTTCREELPGVVGVSCHGTSELAAGLDDLQADFAVLSPVLPTLTHAEAPALGWDGFSDLVRRHRQPVYALGGLRTADLPQALACGAAGLASMRSIWGLEPRPGPGRGKA